MGKSLVHTFQRMRGGVRPSNELGPHASIASKHWSALNEAVAKMVDNSECDRRAVRSAQRIKAEATPGEFFRTGPSCSVYRTICVCALTRTRRRRVASLDPAGSYSTACGDALTTRGRCVWEGKFAVASRLRYGATDTSGTTRGRTEPGLWRAAATLRHSRGATCGVRPARIVACHSQPL